MRYTQRDTPVSAASLAPALYSPERTRVPDAGGGKRTRRRNAGFTSRPRAKSSATWTSCWRKSLVQPNFTHKGFTIWFTGMSGAGKSTVSHILEKRLRGLGARVEVLDGDVVRTNLSKGD